MRDVVHEGRVRADDEHAPQLVSVGVEEKRGAVEADRGLARARPALDDQRRLGLARDQAILVGLDGRDDVAHVGIAAALQLLEQEVVDPGGVDDGAVERLVGDVEYAPPLRAEAAAERDAVRVGGGRRVERTRSRCLPVDDHDLVRVVVHPAAADVERILGTLDVEPAETEAALGVGEGPEAAGRPALDRLGRDLGRARARRADDDLAHAGEARVGVIDVRLLRREIRVTHGRRPSLTRAPRHIVGACACCRSSEEISSSPTAAWRRRCSSTKASSCRASPPSRCSRATRGPARCGPSG